MKVFSPANAEKILVSSYIVLFALSFWWVVKLIRPDSEHFLIWGLVLGGNYFLSMGFYNFCYGLAFFLLCFGYWFKWRKGFGFKQWLVLLILASLLYLTHFFCFLMAQFLIAVTGSFVCLGDVREGKEPGSAPRSFAKLFLRSVVIPELCFLVFMLLNPFRAVGTQYVSHPETGYRLADILQHLRAHYGASIFYLLLDCFGSLAKIFILVTAVFIVIAFYWTFRRSQEPISAVGYGLATFSVVCIAFYIFGVSEYSGTGNGFLRERAGWFGLWGIFAFLASRGWNPRGKFLISATATILCVTSLLSGALWRRQVSPLLKTYDDVARLVEPGKTIFTVCYCIKFNTNYVLFRRVIVTPLLHAGDITALAGRDISLANYEGTSTSFPVEYLPEVNPALHTPKLMEIEYPQVVDLDDYEEKTGKSIDYVIVWGDQQIPEYGSGGDSPLWRQLRARYTLVYSSSGSSPLRLFRKM